MKSTVNAATTRTPVAAIAIQKKIAELTGKLNTTQLRALLTHAESFLSTYNTSQKLSEREEEVLLLISRGYSRREIGLSLGITSNTASTHIANIYQKLGVTNIAEATRYVMQRNRRFD